MRQLIVACFLAILSVVSCRPGATSRRVVIYADGKEISLQTDVRTVREALNAARISIDDDDRVEPDLWVEVQDGMHIRVIRVQQDVIVEREVLPYIEQTIKSEALPAGEKKLLQAGKNGLVEVTYRLRFEDGVEVARSVLRRVVIEEPVNQITVVGVEGLVDSVPVAGTIAYLSGGNAWIMRGTSGGRHPVTGDGHLDGRVFALSPDGDYLLYSVPTDTVEFDAPFNELYLLNVALVGEKPRRLPLYNVLWADWSPDGRHIAYTTGVKSGPPGWKALNDLWTLELRDGKGEVISTRPRRVLSPRSGGEYGWWGTRYAWSPDGLKMAYARPDQVGWIDLTSRRLFPLASFPPPDTHRDQVWTPTVSWSPDSRFIVSTIHRAEPGRPADASQRFEVWALGLDNVVRARLTPPVGMWSAPSWSPAHDGQSSIAYAAAEEPAHSYSSRHQLKVMDRDGSNKRTLFPPAGEIGLAPPITYAWSPGGEQLAVIYQGNLYVIDLASGQAQQLTGDGQSTQLDWAE